MDKPISIVIHAMGGQGGGVLADWIVAVAEAQGWCAQSTSVPGVAQRTGATLYYIEMMRAKPGRQPVLALMPMAGDVDIVIAAELMEAGRAMLRGFVSPTRTLLIASTHRALAVSEKSTPAGLPGDPLAVARAATSNARAVIAFDMQAIAKAAGTVISAPLLGALAASGALPFPRQAFEAALSQGRGADASRQAFAEAFARGAVNDMATPPTAARIEPVPLSAATPTLAALLTRCDSFPAEVKPMLFAGLRRVVAFQDGAYGGQYLDRLLPFLRRDDAQRGFALTQAAAKYGAQAMVYQDVIAVANAKTERLRFSRIRDEMAGDDAPLQITEYLHPRAEELIGLLPRRLGVWMERSPRRVRAVDLLFNRGRHVETTSLWGFLQLYTLGALRRWRRGMLRHTRETAHLDRWLSLAESQAAGNYGLAVGILKARRLIKGYAGTQARGLSKYDRVLSAVPLLVPRADAEAWMDRLIAAALQDEQGTALDGALKTLETL